MGHGGARPGSGRKRGGANKKTREVANRLAGEGVTPLEVMIEAMNAARAAGELSAAAQYAHMAAPYMHPRLQSIDSKTTLNGSLSIVSEFPGG